MKTLSNYCSMDSKNLKLVLAKKHAEWPHWGQTAECHLQPWNWTAKFSAAQHSACITLTQWQLEHKLLDPAPKILIPWVGVKLGNLHFSQSPRWGWCCRPKELTLRKNNWPRDKAENWPRSQTRNYSGDRQTFKKWIRDGEKRKPISTLK